MEAKAKAGEEDLSMEEILQSIRKIIADDGDEAKPDAATNGHLNGSAGASDILELTDAIEEAPMPTPAPVMSAQSATDDILSSIDMALAPVAPAAPVFVAPAPAPAPIATNDQAYIDSLLSTESATAASSAFKKLTPVEAPIAPPQLTPSPVFNSGNTVEAMVMGSLRPMLKEWLDANLPKIVEHIVEREVHKLAH